MKNPITPLSVAAAMTFGACIVANSWVAAGASLVTLWVALNRRPADE